MSASAARRRFTLSLASVCAVLALAAFHTGVPVVDARDTTITGAPVGEGRPDGAGGCAVPSTDVPAAGVPADAVPAERPRRDTIRIYQPPLPSSRPPTA